jgi:hypothetical protein
VHLQSKGNRCFQEYCFTFDGTPAVPVPILLPATSSSLPKSWCGSVRKVAFTYSQSQSTSQQAKKKLQYRAGEHANTVAG